jgi:ADP-ribose pyrophosphatase YjhB (NUDIX family)
VVVNFYYDSNGLEAANMLIVRDKKILLIKRTNFAKDYPNCWSFPGGGLI